MQKILINALAAIQGGGQTYLLNLLEEGESVKDWEIYLLVGSENKNFFSHLEKENSNIHLVLVDLKIKTLFFRVMWENFVLPFLLKKYGIDLFFSVSGILPRLYLPSSCKSVVISHNMLPFSPEEVARFKSWKMRLKFKLIYYSQINSFRKADFLLFTSEHAKRTITPLLRRKISSVVIPNGVPEHFYIKADKRWQDVAPNLEYVLYVSSFFEYKAHREVILAWNMLRKRRATHEKLIFMGFDKTEYAVEIKKLIEELGLQKEIIVKPSIGYNSLPSAYQSAKLILFASSCENCPTILLESLASRRPILCSNYPPMPEFGKDAVLYFDPYNVDDLASKLVDLLNNQRLQIELGARASEEAEKYRSIKSTLATWNTLRGLV